jgi:FkbM family methyltransferase
MNLYSNRFLSDFIHRFIIQRPRLRLALTRLLVRDRDLDVSICGGTLRINSIKEFGYLNAAKNAPSNIVFRDELATVLNLALLLEPGDTFLDIGANAGLYSVLLGRFSFICPHIRRYAFEANPDTAQRLRISVAPFGVQVESYALSDKAGKLQFSSGAVSGVFAAHSPSSPAPAGTPLVEVETRRLDAMPLEGNSLVAKIDVEGHEWQVLQGASGLFAAKRFKAVYLDGYSDARIPDFLRTQGFDLFDGRSLQPSERPGFSLLAIHRDWLKRHGGLGKA